MDRVIFMRFQQILTTLFGQVALLTLQQMLELMLAEL